YRFWTTVLKSDPSVIGKQIRLGERSAIIVGVLEPSVPYPAETEIIPNVVTSPHHLSATMVTGRVHRMTELFGRLAPGATLESANAELSTVLTMTIRGHFAAYAQIGDNRMQIAPRRRRDDPRRIHLKQRSRRPYAPLSGYAALRPFRDSWHRYHASNAF